MTLRHRLHRVLYVPVDDRPYNLKAPRCVAEMVDYEMLVPPAELLGSFRTPGQPDEIASWLRTHSAGPWDCIILSLDSLLYGGLWASRTSGTRTQLAMDRLEILRDLRAACDCTILCFSTILRLGTVTSADEAAQHLEGLAHYSALDDGQEDNAEQLAALKRQIPASVLGEYQAIRQRNHEVNLRIARELADGNVDFLVYAQDTSGRTGVHQREQRELAAECVRHGVSDKTMILPGVDQMGMALFARFVHGHMDKYPHVRLLLPQGCDGSAVPCGEDRPVIDTLRGHLALINAVEADAATTSPDMYLAVNPPAGYDRADLQDPETARRHRENAREFVASAHEAAERRGLAVCDVGFGNGADDIFVQELISATPELPRLLSYAGWNSAANSVGSSLAHATMRLISLQDKGAFDLARVLGDLSPMRYLSLLDSLITSEKAHIRFLMHRFTDDWLYQSRVRPRLLDHICSGIRSGLFDLSGSYQQAEALMRDQITQAATDLWIDQFLGRHCVLIGSDVAGDEQSELVLAELEETRLSLPWRRLFEIDLELEFGVQLVAAGAEE